MFGGRKKLNSQISYFPATTTKPSDQVKMEEGRLRRLHGGGGGGGGTGRVGMQCRGMWKRSKNGMWIRVKDFVVVA